MFKSCAQACPAAMAITKARINRNFMFIVVIVDLVAFNYSGGKFTKYFRIKKIN